MSYLKHFKSEFGILRERRPNDFILSFENEFKEVLNKFSQLELSGSGAPIVGASIAHSLKCLFEHKPLSPLSLEDEWIPATDFVPDSPEDQFLNKRDFRVYMNSEGFFFSNPFVFQREEDSATFTSNMSFYKDFDSCLRDEPNSRFQGNKVKIKEFPFTPKTFYLHLKTEGDKEYVKNTEVLKEAESFFDLVWS